MTTPETLIRGPINAVAAALGVLTTLRTGSLIAAIVIGVGVTALLRALG